MSEKALSHHLDSNCNRATQNLLIYALNLSYVRKEGLHLDLYTILDVIEHRDIIYEQLNIINQSLDIVMNKNVPEIERDSGAKTLITKLTNLKAIVEDVTDTAGSLVSEDVKHVITRHKDEDDDPFDEITSENVFDNLRFNKQSYTLKEIQHILANRYRIGNLYDQRRKLHVTRIKQSDSDTGRNTIVFSLDGSPPKGYALLHNRGYLRFYDEDGIYWREEHIGEIIYDE